MSYINKELSQREKEVISLVAQGLPNKSVGQMLFITEKTVKNHLILVFKKLGVKSREELTSWFLAEKLSTGDIYGYSVTGTSENTRKTRDSLPKLLGTSNLGTKPNRYQSRY